MVLSTYKQKNKQTKKESCENMALFLLPKNGRKERGKKSWQKKKK